MDPNSTFYNFAFLTCDNKNQANRTGKQRYVKTKNIKPDKEPGLLTGCQEGTECYKAEMKRGAKMGIECHKSQNNIKNKSCEKHETRNRILRTRPD